VAGGGRRLQKLWKTTIVIWSDYDGDTVELENLARAATVGDAYCSKQVSVLVDEPSVDPDWDSNEFFYDGDDEG
jgi:hypothetical protein